jgi:ATP-dependent helicase HrpA
MVARIDPSWIEPLAGALAQRTYSEPMWSPRHARAQCTERVTMLGLPIITDRRIPYDRVDPRRARELFIEHALVRGEWKHQHAELHDNAQRVEEARERAQRGRISGDGIDEESLARFFDVRVPDDVTSGRAFDAWWRRTRARNPTCLTLDDELLASLPAEEDFPGTWPGTDWPVTYRFAPGDPLDGVTIHVPVSALASLRDDEFLRQVPGYREEMMLALLRALPKGTRRAIGPAPDAARLLVGRIHADGVRASLSAATRELFDVVVAPEDWPFVALPEHLRPTISVEDDDAQNIGIGKELGDLQRRCARQTVAAIRSSLPDVERDGVTAWPESLPESVGLNGVVGYPGLAPLPGGTIGVRVFATSDQRDGVHRNGAAHLLCHVEPFRPKDLRLSDQDMLRLARNPQGSVRALLEDARVAVAYDLMDQAGGAPTTESEFEGLRDALRVRQIAEVRSLLLGVIPVFDSWWNVQSRLALGPSEATARAYDDAAAQLARLVDGDVLSRWRAAGIPDLLRYLQALHRRLQSLPHDAARDLLRMEQVHRVEDAVAHLPTEKQLGDEALSILRDVEELRVSLWAQDLGTRGRVSEKRLLDRVAMLRASAP